MQDACFFSFLKINGGSFLGAYESPSTRKIIWTHNFDCSDGDYVTPLRDGLRESKGLESAYSRKKLRAVKDVCFYSEVREMGLFYLNYLFRFYSPK